MVLAPSSQRNPASELVRIFPPALSAASNTVTFTPRFRSLYAAASPLTPAPTTATDLAGAARGSSEPAIARTGRGRLARAGAGR
uniref:Protoporphyrinogen IX oxidase n=1 Tax=Arundo donax TaxID=35708 RepID=A0A0A9HNY9_ARUDO